MSGTDRAVTWGGPEWGGKAKRAAKFVSSGFLWFPLRQNPERGCQPRGGQESEKGSPDTTVVPGSRTQESPKGEVLKRVLPEWECFSQAERPSRAASNSLIDLRIG